MRKLNYGIVVLWLFVCCAASHASTQVSIGIGLPNVSIGINLPVFPELVPIRGYPVYYAPRLEANYFFYDGMYWVFQDDYWYASNWYNGPWWPVEPDVLPLYILRIPVRYYRSPPVYFRDWRRDAPPRWGSHWGRDWEHKRRGWDRWNRSSAPRRAPLPVYQRQYTGDRYPRQVEQQQTLRRQHYRYEPRDKTVRRHFEPQRERPVPARPERHEEPRVRNPDRHDNQRPAPLRQGDPAVRRPPLPHQPPPQQREPGFREQREQPDAIRQERPGPRPQDHGQRLQERERAQEPRGLGQEQRRDEERGRDRNR